MIVPRILVLRPTYKQAQVEGHPLYGFWMSDPYLYNTAGSEKEYSARSKL